MEENPDSALLILKSINKDEIKNDKDKAYYNLLFTQAAIKTDSIMNDPSDISAATEYIDKHGSEFDRMRAWFYKGYVFFQNEDFGEAIYGALNAIDLANAQNNAYWQAKAYELAAFIYNRVSLFEDAVKCASIAANKYEDANKILNKYYTLIDIAVDYIGMNNYNQAINLLDSIKLIKSDDFGVTNYWNNTMITSLFYQNDYSKIDHISDSLFNEKYDSFDTYTKLIIAEAKIELNKLQDAQQILENTNPTHDAMSTKKKFHRVYSLFYNRKGNTEKYYQHLDSSYFYHDKFIADVKYNKTVFNNRMDYNKAKADNIIRLKNQKFTFGIIVLIILILISFSIWFIHNWNQKRKLSELENRVGLMSSLSEQLSNSKNEKESLVLLIEKMMKDRWRLLNSIYDEYYERGDSVEGKNYVMKQIESDVNKNREIAKLDELIDIVDVCTNGNISKLKEQCPELKKEDIILFALICAGISSKSISLLMDLKHKSFYSRKDRLIAKIEKINPKDSDLFTNMLKNGMKNFRKK